LRPASFGPSVGERGERRLLLDLTSKKKEEVVVSIISLAPLKRGERRREGKEKEGERVGRTSLVKEKKGGEKCFSSLAWAIYLWGGKGGGKGERVRGPRINPD